MSETIYVIDSDRPATNGKSVKGQKGRGYRMSDAPGQVYIVGTDWYWRGPESETHSYLPPAQKSAESVLASGNYFIPKSVTLSSNFSGFMTTAANKFSIINYEVIYDSANEGIDIRVKKNPK